MQLLRVRIEFRVKHARAGVYFQGDVMHTNNQLRRARCWFPCADTSDHPHRCVSARERCHQIGEACSLCRRSLNESLRLTALY